MTLGELIDKLKQMPQDKLLYIDGPVRLTPGKLMSYRGYYEDLAIGVVMGSYSDLTVGDFLAKCEEAVGKTFEGYKGGHFRMSRETRVWFSNYGEADSNGPSDVVLGKYNVTIKYACMEE